MENTVQMFFHLIADRDEAAQQDITNWLDERYPPDQYDRDEQEQAVYEEFVAPAVNKLSDTIKKEKPRVVVGINGDKPQRLREFPCTPDGYSQAVDFIDGLEGAEEGRYYLDAPENLAAQA